MLHASRVIGLLKGLIRACQYKEKMQVDEDAFWQVMGQRRSKGRKGLPGEPSTVRMRDQPVYESGVSRSKGAQVGPSSQEASAPRVDLNASVRVRAGSAR